MKTLRRAPAASARLDILPSAIHGRGVFAVADLEAGLDVGRYAGRRYPAGTARPDWDGRVTYLFLLSDGTLIDGARGGNLTRHINHACRPNVEALEMRDRRGVLGIQLRTKRRIRRGEELLLDYALDIPDDDPSNYPCRCGDKACRGSLAASPGTGLLRSAERRLKPGILRAPIQAVGRGKSPQSASAASTGSNLPKRG